MDGALGEMLEGECEVKKCSFELFDVEEFLKVKEENDEHHSDCVD